MDEAIYYNALAVALRGDRRKLAKAKNKYENWSLAYERMKRGVPDPEREWGKLLAVGVQLILFREDVYPPILREIADPPFGIYVLGNMPDDARRKISVVGTRRATPEGKTIARKFARELAQADFTVVSGLAFGIDAAAHEGCLDANGQTIAVLACGLDAIYPRENEHLAKNILAHGGAIISEYPLGGEPLAYRFLERNRIISGISQGVLVVEAPDGSGSLVTARLALEQNRDVFVVPGPISHPNFFGSHALIRQGAELVTKTEDIFATYGVTPEALLAKEKLAASPEETLILKALAEVSGPVDVDKIITATRLEPRVVNRSLATLVLRDIVKEQAGGYTI